MNAFLFIGLLAALSPFASPQEGVISEAFPVWTYYAEIYEHYAILLVALLGVVAAAVSLNSVEQRHRNAVRLFGAGWAVIALSQVLVNAHHYGVRFLFPWTAIVHHGALLLGFAVLLYAFNGLLKGLGKRD